MEDVKEALDKAAASSDQAVRSMALRYQEMQREFDQYEAFFKIYKLGIKSNGSAAPRNGATAPRQERIATTSTPRASKVDTFSTAMRDILVSNGQPMKLNDVYTTYQGQHPEDQTTIETFRQRLVKRRGTVVLVPKRGYWWADAPLSDPPDGE